MSIILILLFIGLVLVLVYETLRPHGERRQAVITFSVTITTLQRGPEGTPRYNVSHAQGVLGLPTLLSAVLGYIGKSR